MRGDQRVQGRERSRAGADLVGQRRDRQRDPLPGEALALAIQRLMLAEFLEQDRGQEVRLGKAARRDVEGRGRLRDRLAGPAREALAHGLDHLPGPRDHLQRLRDVLAELRQLGRTTAGAALRGRNENPLAREMGRERLARWGMAGRQAGPQCARQGSLGGGRLFRGGRFQLFQFELHLVDEPCRALRARAVELAPQLLDLQLEMRDQRRTARSVRLGAQPRSALGQDHGVRGGEVGRERLGRRGHGGEGITAARSCKGPTSPDRAGPPDLLGMTPVDAREQVAHLRR